MKALVRLGKGVIALILVRPRKYKLHVLLSQITKKNLHREVMTGSPLGNETW
jgi:hypothetical protein